MFKVLLVPPICPHTRWGVIKWSLPPMWTKQFSRSYVAKYEGGERRLDVIEFLAICKVLRAEPCKLIAGL